MSLSVFIKSDEKSDKTYKLILLKNKLIKQWGRRTSLILREQIIEFDLAEEAHSFYEKECVKRLKRNYSKAPKGMSWYQGKLFN